MGHPPITLATAVCVFFSPLATVLHAGSRVVHPSQFYYRIDRGTIGLPAMISKRWRKKMSENLLKWPNLDSTELRILLHEIIGGMGQADLAGLGSGKPVKFYLPLAGPDCRVVLTFKGKNVVTIEPGQAFDPAQWQEISNQIEHSILTGPTRVGREYSFSGHRVLGSWRGERSGVQILPAPGDAPSAPVELADHPFILEFPLRVAGLNAVTNYRRLRKHRDLTLLLNILLVGGAKSMGFRPTHFWGVDPADLSHNSKWVQQGFFAPLGSILIDGLSTLAADQLEELAPEEYETVLGHDGRGLRVPSNLDQSICSYEALSAQNRVKFDRAAFWFGTATGMRDVSISASFAGFASAIESLTSRGKRHDFKFCPVCGKPGKHEVPGATRLFKNFLATYAPDASLAKDRDRMYGLRSAILHGSDLMELDQCVPIMGWSPWGHEERELYNGMWRVTRTALRNWLKSPPPQSSYLQKARELCAYFHWIERSRPLWHADDDWEWAEQEFPRE